MRGVRREAKWYSCCDYATEGLLYFMLVFAPWAFGATLPWTMWMLNIAGYLLGALLVAKWLFGGSPANDAFRPLSPFSVPSSVARAVALLLAVLTLLILLYSLLHALNARATYLAGFSRFEYHDHISWLPHSYDRPSSWFAFWQYLALASFFWALVYWLVGGWSQSQLRSQANRRTRKGEKREVQQEGLSQIFSGDRLISGTRLQRLLWVVCLNGALVAIQGDIQRIMGSTELLWLVEPTFNKNPLTFFGPYAYRANASQFFNLIWPVSLGFWWHLHRAYHIRHPEARLGDGGHHILIFATLLMAAAPIVSTSRGGTAIAAGLVLTTLLIFWFSRRRGWAVHGGVVLIAVAGLGFGLHLGWGSLQSRLSGTTWEALNRAEPGSWELTEDYPLFGSGPDTFDELHGYYRPENAEHVDWAAYVHNDWLETWITFGCIGFGLILLALLCVPTYWWFHRARSLRYFELLDLLICAAMAGCLIHAFFDFPFQMYSLVLYFLLLSGILCSFPQGTPKP